MMGALDRRAARLRLRTTLDSAETPLVCALRILLPLLALAPQERLVLDLRSSPAAFAARHLAHATHVRGWDELKQRFSTLPPRHVPFLIVCDAADEAAVRENLGGGRRNLLGVVLCGAHAEEDGGAEEEFWHLAEILGLTARCKTEDLATRRLQDPQDRPFLLCKPAPAVVRAVHWAERQRTNRNEAESPQELRALDLGCGAGRDLAWIAYEHAAPGRQRGCWRVRGVDNLRPALERAALLMQDFGLTPAETGGDGDRGASSNERSSATSLGHMGGCDGLLWAEVTRAGLLNALSGGGRGPRKATRLDAPTGTAPGAGAGASTAPSAVPLDHSWGWEERTDADVEEQCKALSAFAQEHFGAASSPGGGSRPTSTFDLLILVRFLPRALIRALPALTHAGSVVVLSHFYHYIAATAGEAGDAEEAPLPRGARADYEGPPPAARLQRGDVERLRAAWERLPVDFASAPGAGGGLRQQWEVAEQVLEPIEDGRVVQSTVLVRVR